MTICIAGKNEIAINALKYTLENKPDTTNLVACFNDKDSSINNWQPSFIYFCNLNNIPVVNIQDCYKIEDLNFFSLEYDRIIKVDKFKTKQLFNIHFSLLPAYKGMYTSALPILKGEKFSGVTLHMIDQGIDTGAIVDQVQFEIGDHTNAGELYKMYLDYGFKLFTGKFHQLIKESYSITPQNSSGASYYSKKTIDYSNIYIDLNKTAFEIHNQIRAFSFREYQLPVVRNKIIYRSLILEQRSKRVAGNIECETSDYIDISTIDFIVRLFIDKEEELFKAAEAGDLSKIKEIQASGFDIKTINKRGWNILIVACYNEHTGLVRWLLKNEFNVNSSNYKGTTALMYALTASSVSGRMDILDCIFEYKPDINSKDDKGLTVLDYVTRSGNKQIAEYFTRRYNV